MHSLPHTLTPDKILYTFYPKNTKDVGVLIFLDKYGQEWTLLNEKELETYQHMGVPVTFYFKGEIENEELSVRHNSTHAKSAAIGQKDKIHQKKKDPKKS